jgi:hypothetical protein
MRDKLFRAKRRCKAEKTRKTTLSLGKEPGWNRFPNSLSMLSFRRPRTLAAYTTNDAPRGFEVALFFGFLLFQGTGSQHGPIAGPGASKMHDGSQPTRNKKENHDHQR